MKQVKQSLPPPRDNPDADWTVLLDCGHTIYGVQSADGKRPREAHCPHCPVTSEETDR